MDCSLPCSSVHGIFQARVGCHFLLQGIFLTQGSNPGLLHYQQMLYCPSHQGSTPSINLANVLYSLMELMAAVFFPVSKKFNFYLSWVCWQCFIRLPEIHRAVSNTASFKIRCSGQVLSLPILPWILTLVLPSSFPLPFSRCLLPSEIDIHYKHTFHVISHLTQKHAEIYLALILIWKKENKANLLL